MNQVRTRLAKFGRLLGHTIAWLSVLAFCVWSVGAIYFLTFLPRATAVLAALVYVIGVVVILVRVANKRTALSLIAASICVVFVITRLQRPSNDRTWNEDQSETAKVVLSEDNVTINNYRFCRYQSETEFDAQFSTHQFKLEQLESVWFLVHKFSPLEGMAHTFLSFGLDTPQGKEYFSVSIEIRREKGEVYSPLRGLYRQFELMVIVGDERDLIGVRTVMRPTDRVHLYRVNATPDQVQQLFVDIAGRINDLHDQPEFYHTFLNNCTTGIVTHTYDLMPEKINWLDPRIVMPGYSDRVAFAYGLIGARGQAFDQLKADSRIDDDARRIGLTEQFSTGIRER